jgi:hypothetical protein
MNVTDLPQRMQRKIRVVDSGCWEWTGAHSSNGYGSVRVMGVTHSTHRFTYQYLVGPIPDGLQIDHLCRNKHCCHPAHLEPVTAQVNSLRRPDVNKPFCVNGHEMTDANTHVRTRRDGYTMRNCRICRRNDRKSRPEFSPTVLTDGSVRHGTTTGYSYYKCRCADCRGAFAEYMREYRRKKSA